MLDLTISVWTSLGHPLGEVADEVEEELVLRDAEDLVHHLHKEAEALTHKKFEKMEALKPGQTQGLAAQQGFCRDLELSWTTRPRLPGH